MKYHVWTEGCQMNVADSQRVASELEKLGYHATRNAESADVIAPDRGSGRQILEVPLCGELRWERSPGVMGRPSGVALTVAALSATEAFRVFRLLHVPPSGSS